jgi:hypothetical protein
MRVSKFLSITGFLTLFSLLYVYQQTEIFRLAYVGQNKSAFCQDLLDKNSILRYNIEKRASLVSIGNRISGSAEFQMPDSYRLVRLMPAKEGLRARNQSPNKQTLVSRLFGIKRQAEANTINP